MKCIKAEVLDTILYTDRAKQVPARMENAEGEIQDLTVRACLRNLLDLPLPKGYTRSISKQIDRIWDGLGVPDLIIEDVDFKYLSTLVEESKMSNKMVYDSLCLTIDCGTEWKAA